MVMGLDFLISKALSSVELKNSPQAKKRVAAGTWELKEAQGRKESKLIKVEPLHTTVLQ
jgi:hypothetical protein